MRAIEARAVVGAAPEELFTRLADLRAHWELAGRWVEPVELRAEGGVVRVRGPLGLSRTARTELHEAVAPHRLAGTAQAGATCAEISWTLRPAGAGATEVTLRAELVRVAPLDRLLLTLGGAAWMRWRFAAVLGRLG